MSGPKRQHYVPKMILERFKDDDGKLYSFSKCHPEKIIYAHPNKLFAKSHSYTQIGSDRAKNFDVEKRLSRLENDAAPIVRKIICTARTGKCPELTSLERGTWDEFVFSQGLRVPDVLDIAFQDKFGKSVCKTDEQNVKARAVLGVWEDEGGKDVLRDLGSMGLAIAVIANPKRSLIIGSNPILKLGHPLEDSISEYWFPITS